MAISSGLERAGEHALGVRVITHEGDGHGQDPNMPDYQNAAYIEMIDDVVFCRTVDGGTKAMRAAKKAYLPQGPKEQDDEYDVRLARAVLYPAFSRTAGGLVGMIFRKDPILAEELLPLIVEHMANVDLTGRPLSVFARDVSNNAMVDGHSWIVVEHPRVDLAAVNSRADERMLGVRPYWLNILKQDVLNWRTEMVDGRAVLTLLAYRETMSDDSGTFGEDIKEVVRVLYPSRFEVWEFQKDGDKSRWALIDEGLSSLDYIPAVPVYTGRTAPFMSTPPLLELAYLNVGHWQTYSDRQFTLKFAGSPMPWFAGTDPTGIEWGANRALFMPEADAKAGLLESSGNSLPEQRLELKDIESRMASLGLQKLVAETRAAETEGAKRIDKAESDSALAVMATAIEGGLLEALAIHADYMNVELPDNALTINKDYRNQEISPQQMMALLAMVEAGRLPVTEMWAIMQRGEVLPEDYDHALALESLDVPEPPPFTE